MAEYKKINDYMLDVTEPFGPGKGTLSRLFNFAAATVTTLYHEKETVYYCSDISTALTSQMNIMRFSDFDSVAEIEDMRKILVEKGGKPPELDPMLTRKLPKNKLGGA